MSVEELTENARAILSNLHTDNENADAKQQKADMILDQSMMFADNVLKRLVAHTLDVDIDELFDTMVKTRGEILIVDNQTEHCELSQLLEPQKYTMGLDIVDHDYMLDLGRYADDPKVKEQMVFLLNTVKVLYCPIKDYMKTRTQCNGSAFNYVLQIGLNTTLFLDKDSKKRIGIVLKKV